MPVPNNKDAVSVRSVICIARHIFPLFGMFCHVPHPPLSPSALLDVCIAVTALSDLAFPSAILPVTPQPSSQMQVLAVDLFGHHHVSSPPRPHSLAFPFRPRALDVIKQRRHRHPIPRHRLPRYTSDGKGSHTHRFYRTFPSLLIRHDSELWRRSADYHVKTIDPCRLIGLWWTLAL